MKKTLGGDRLGTGRKMQVDIQEFGRSTFNRSFIWRSSQAAGTVVPFLCEVALPGDTHDIGLRSDMKTHPTLGPLFGSYKIQYEIYVAAIKLYNGMLHNNAVDLGLHMENVTLPKIEFLATEFLGTEEDDLDNFQINPSAIMPYLGVRGIGFTGEVGGSLRRFNAVPILMYWDIIKNYHSNKQEEIGAVIHTPAPLISTTVDVDGFQAAAASSGTVAPGAGNTIPLQPATPALIQLNQPYNFYVSWTGLRPKPETIMVNTSIGYLSLDDLSIGNTTVPDAGRFMVAYNFSKYGAIEIYDWRYLNGNDVRQGKPAIATFPLSNIDEMREYIMQQTGSGEVVIANPAGTAPALAPYSYLPAQPNGIPNILSSQEGLALKTYLSDQFNNWLNTEFIDGAGGVNDRTKVAIVDDAFGVENLIMSNKLYLLLNAITMSGGTYRDWQEVNWGVKPNMGAEMPVYMGGMHKELQFGEVVSNAANETQPLGTLAGRGYTDESKGGKVMIKVKELSYVMGLTSITPRIDYSQGNRWDSSLLTVNDFHTPWLDGIGFQDLITEKMAWWDTHRDGIAGIWVTKSAGKQVAWMDYMTNNNRTFGNFAVATNEMFMTLNRRYEATWDGIPTIKDLTTYIDPSKFNYIFAEQQLDAMNFWHQIAVDYEVRSVMAHKQMPKL